jgi:hypothetical protein
MPAALLVLLNLLLPPAGAANKVAPRKAAPVPRPSAVAPAAGDRVLWDVWYTVTVNKVIHYEYSNDRMEIRGGRLVATSHSWKQREDFISEEQLETTAANERDLLPVGFKARISYRSVETTIEGTVEGKGSRELVVRIRKGDTELPPIRHPLPPRTILSSFLSLWVTRHFTEFKTGQVYPFSTLLEDSIEADFTPTPGQIRVEPSDEIATRTHTVKLTVNYHDSVSHEDMKSLWWIEPTGVPVRIEMPLQKSVIRASTPAEAQKFLDEGN